MACSTRREETKKVVTGGAGPERISVAEIALTVEENLSLDSIVKEYHQRRLGWIRQDLQQWQGLPAMSRSGDRIATFEEAKQQK